MQLSFWNLIVLYTIFRIHEKIVGIWDIFLGINVDSIRISARRGVCLSIRYVFKLDLICLNLFLFSLTWPEYSLRGRVPPPSI